MDLQWSDEDLAFQAEVREFFATRLTPELRRAGATMTSVYADKPAALAWQRILLERGWAAPAWPVEYGGCDWTIPQFYIFARERALAGAPPTSPMGIDMVAHAIMHYGTTEQKSFFLPRMLSGEHFWCQGYSEPEAGSDLAALQMQARDDGDDLVCTGSKIWSTHAHEANWIFCLVRTRQAPKKQDGITFLLIDMATPGVTVRPLVMTSGEHVQNQVFFDEVRVPKANVLGEIDRGWTVAKHLLEFERGGRAYAPDMKVRLEELARRAAKQPGDDGGSLLDDAAFRRKLAQLQVRVDVLEVFEFRIMAALSADRPLPGAPSMMKILGTELAQQISELTLEAAGRWALAYQPHAGTPGGEILGRTPSRDYVAGETWAALAPLRYLNQRAGSIYAGSNEIQRNILAKAVLGL